MNAVEIDRDEVAREVSALEKELREAESLSKHTDKEIKSEKVLQTGRWARRGQIRAEIEKQKKKKTLPAKEKEFKEKEIKAGEDVDVGPLDVVHESYDAYAMEVEAYPRTPGNNTSSNNTPGNNTPGTTQTDGSYPPTPAYGTPGLLDTPSYRQAIGDGSGTIGLLDEDYGIQAVKKKALRGRVPTPEERIHGWQSSSGPPRNPGIPDPSSGGFSLGNLAGSRDVIDTPAYGTLGLLDTPSYKDVIDKEIEVLERHQKGYSPDSYVALDPTLEEVPEVHGPMRRAMLMAYGQDSADKCSQTEEGDFFLLMEQEIGINL